MKEISIIAQGENLFSLFAADRMAVKEHQNDVEVEMRVLAYGDKYNMAENWSIEVAMGAFAEHLPKLATGEDYAHCYGDGHEGNVTKILANTRKPPSEAGGMAFYDKEDGLYAKLTLPDTTAGRDIATLLRAGVIGNVSIGMFVDNLEYQDIPAEEEGGSDFHRGEIKEARIVEVSFVHRGKFKSAQVMSVTEVQAKLGSGTLTCAEGAPEVCASADAENTSVEASLQPVLAQLRKLESDLSALQAEAGRSSEHVCGNVISGSGAEERLPIKNAAEILIGVRT